VDVDMMDKLMVAASGIIPIFKFIEWRYTNLFEILLYPDTFDDNFEISGSGRRILGMVGAGYMEGKMILSKPALHHGFDNGTDKRNTAIHEFIHLIDKMDGNIDGIPTLLIERPYMLP
jgi:Mlc titration factor MtfA (ptsG expression regulator)